MNMGQPEIYEQEGRELLDKTMTTYSKLTDNIRVISGTSDVYLPVSGSLVAYRLPYGAG